MKLVLASLASKPRKTVICGVDYAVTDRAFLNTKELFVKIAFPN